MIYEIFGSTTIGPVRARNEDHILIGQFVKNRGWLELRLTADDESLSGWGLPIAVADGIGGNAGGEMASRVALETLVKILAEQPNSDASKEKNVEKVFAALHRVNDAVRKAQAADRGLANMGTTLSAVLLQAEGQHWVIHAGDSRVLRIRNGYVKLLTRDDNLAEQLLKTGIDRAAVDANPDSATLLNWVGCADFVPNANTGTRMEPADDLVICSDGLHGFLSEDSMIAALANRNRPLELAVQEMITSAIDAGSTDNISIVVVRARDEQTV